MSIDSIVQWIEEHPATTDVLKWTALIAVGWFSGGFSYIRNLTRKPRIRVSKPASRCFLEVQKDEREGGATNVIRASFLHEIEVSNPSRTEIVVRTFDVRIKSARKWWPWLPRISAVSLPSRVRQAMGSGTKMIRNWFAFFDDGYDHLTVTGVISPGHAESGFALFVSVTYGSWNPIVKEDEVFVIVRAGLANGKTVRCKTKVQVMQDADSFEEMVPGVLDQVRHPTAWNTPLRHS